MQPKLFELGIMLNYQLPVLVSFVFLRQAGVFTTSKALYALTPARVRTHVDTAIAGFARLRRVVMASGLACLALQTFYAPPEDVCTEYEAVKAQGISALLSLAVIMTTNHALASAVAIGALRAVASTSAVSVVLSTSAAVISSSGTDTLLFTYALFWVALGHVAWCNSDSHPTRTHGSIIAVLAIIFNVILYLSMLFYRRCLRVAAGMVNGSARLARLCKRAVA